MRFCLLLVCLFLLFLQACAGSSKAPTAGFDSIAQSVVYGKDDRVYTDQHPDAKLRKLAAAVAVLISYSRVNIDDTTKAVTLDGDNLTTRISKSSDYNQLHLCSGEPFRLDHSPGSCTGFLIGPTLLATAGHCLGTRTLSVQDAQSWCNYRAFVFGFKKGRALVETDVYRCRRVLVHGYATSPNKLDYALIELRTPVQGIQPLPFDPKPALKKGDTLAVIGHPHGTYQKIAAGGAVYDPRASSLDYFSNTLDTMPGNSGSPVFSLSTYKAIGIHVRGARPVYTVDTANKCNKSNVLSDGVGRQSANYLQRITGATCTTDANCPATHFCEQGGCHYRTVDLQIVSATLSQQSGRIGDTVKVDVTVKNAGNFTTKDDYRIGIWWSSNGTICATCGQDKDLAGLIVQGSLAPGASVTRSFSIPIVGPFVQGQQYIGVLIDDSLLVSNKYSYYGKVAERDEDNNQKSIPFTISGTCSNKCGQPGDLRCSGNAVQTCSKDAAGCLDWRTSKTCEGSKCDQGRCVTACTNNCNLTDPPRCKDNGIEQCKQDAQGCKSWQILTACSSAGELCKDAQCIPKPRENGESCTVNIECKSGTCAPQQEGKVCAATCKSNSDCTQPTQPFCKGGVCQVIPEGACITEKDCDPGHECLRLSCFRTPSHEPLGDGIPTAEATPEVIAEPGQTEDAGVEVTVKPPPDGCGCSQGPGDLPVSGWVWLVCLGFFGIVRRRY